MSPSTSPPPEKPGEDLPVSFSDVTRFIRQLSHDLRNHLNAAELQTAYLGEIAEDAEMKEEVKRLRAMLGEMSASLQRVTHALAAIKPTAMPYDAGDFMEDLRAKISTQFPAESETIEWGLETGRAQLEIDPQLVQSALVELFANAFQHERGSGALRAAAEVKGGEFVFRLHEPKASFSGDVERWGRQPFQKMRHGHYGLGLPRARGIIEAHGGKLRAEFDAASSTLVTTVAIPLGGE